MKFKQVLGVLTLIGLTAGVFTIAFAATTAAEDAGAPAVKAIAPLFQFEPTIEGQEVLHDFVIQNTGTAELKIQRVKTG